VQLVSRSFQREFRSNVLKDDPKCPWGTERDYCGSTYSEPISYCFSIRCLGTTEPLLRNSSGDASSSGSVRLDLLTMRIDLSSDPARCSSRGLPCRSWQREGRWKRTFSVFQQGVIRRSLPHSSRDRPEFETSVTDLTSMWLRLDYLLPLSERVRPMEIRDVCFQGENASHIAVVPGLSRATEGCPDPRHYGCCGPGRRRY
jgi:hypothetical protein